MKKLSAIILLFVFILSFAACKTKTEQKKNQSVETLQSQPEKSDVSISEFSYAKDCERYADGDPGVKTSGFVNITKTDVSDDNITEIAKRDCTIEYNSSKVFKDSTTGIWKVDFFTEGVIGGGQSVYLDSEGKTILIVYGE